MNRFLFDCMSFLCFFGAERILEKFIALVITFRKIHGRKVVSFYRVDSSSLMTDEPNAHHRRA